MKPNRREATTQECPVAPSFLPVRYLSEREIALLMWCAAVEGLQDDEIKAAAYSEGLSVTQPLPVVE